MMTKERAWRLSRYTSVIRDSETGDILLHNSFMGAVARISADQSKSIEMFLQRSSADDIHGPSQYRFPYFEGLFQREVKESDLSNLSLKELCEGGFFVPSDVEEREIVSEILDHERDKSGFQVIILPHENCNFRCVYCYETFVRGKMKPEVVTGLKAFVDRKVKECNSLAISWFGGEPLLAKDVIYELSDFFIASCITNNIPYASGMTTNGYFLTPDVVTLLLQRKINHFQVTLDGPEATHNNTRKLAGGGETYQKILNNLMAMGHRDEEFSVRIRVNFNNAVISSMEQFLSEIAPMFKNDIRFNLDFHPIGKWGGPNDSAFDICDEELARQSRLNLIKRTLTVGFSDQLVKDSLISHGTVCYAGKESSIVVGSDGTVYKCTVAFEDPRNQVGKLTKDGQLVIDQARWNLWVKFDDKNASKCTSCSFSPSCQSRSCPLAAINQKEPPCPFTKTEYESMVKLVAIRRAAPITH